MLIYGDCFAVLEFPAAYAPTGAFCAISAAYFPIVGDVGIFDDLAHGEIVRIRLFPVVPVGEDQNEVSGLILVPKYVVNDVGALGKYEMSCSGGEVAHQ